MKKVFERREKKINRNTECKNYLLELVFSNICGCCVEYCVFAWYVHELHGIENEKKKMKQWKNAVQMKTERKKHCLKWLIGLQNEQNASIYNLNTVKCHLFYFFLSYFK